MSQPALINENPQIFSKSSNKQLADYNDAVEDPFTPAEIFNTIKNISDPEHPLSLEQLNVVSERLIRIQKDEIHVRFTPTIPHCSMATLIGLCIRVQLLRSLPSRWKIIVSVEEGSHQSERAVNKQLNDKERVAAAMENGHLLGVVNQCLKTSVY